MKLDRTVVQEVMYSSGVPDLILTSDNCLCGGLQGFSALVPPQKNMLVGGLIILKLPLGVN